MFYINKAYKEKRNTFNKRIMGVFNGLKKQKGHIGQMSLEESTTLLLQPAV